MPDPLESAFERLAQQANHADEVKAWPEASWQALRESGALAWSIPSAYGGQNLEGVELLARYERLASACLTSCFILSQRDAACRRIVGSGNEELCRELLPPLARGDTFATVGLSQLTTSRQHVRPALTARAKEDHFVLDGFMPWVTGAARADHFVTGAVLEDGRQILAALPRNLPGVDVQPALDLMALQSSMTAEVRCENVVVSKRWLLAGPVEKVLAKRGMGGGLETSCLALGLAGAAVDYLLQQAEMRPDLQDVAGRLQKARQTVRDELYRLAEGGGEAEAALALRARANSLVLRATQAALAAGKGAAFLKGHPAQRWARQALFFLVWSCPRPAAEATLHLLASDVCD
ncbi:MAG: hypothetical protein KatS3mg105_4590 [Gemmatales bacterium]|nr:MAG: hypothetical protein KatS3mg105_4590 [Gemmatales bacterium]